MMQWLEFSLIIIIIDIIIDIGEENE